MAASQSTDSVLMIRPVRFGANPQTAASNAFQRDMAGPDQVQEQALREFDSLAAVLRDAGVWVHVIEDTPEPHTPDSIFPNNWFSTHDEGSVYLYPMEAPNRRLERRSDLLEKLRAEGYRVGDVTDLSSAEGEGRYLEGTGSLVLDRVNRIAYACLSSRTESGLLSRWGEQAGYRIVSFDARDAAGRAIYHTNVMMCVGSAYAVVCAEAITDPERWSAVRAELEDTGHEIIEISLRQMDQFAGNMLELRPGPGEVVLVMSARAESSLDRDQRMRLEAHVRIVSAAIDTIEDCAGGSVRCMLAEIFLPRTTAV